MNIMKVGSVNGGNISFIHLGKMSAIQIQVSADTVGIVVRDLCLMVIIKLISIY